MSPLCDVRLARYSARLANFDWQYEYSDDQRVYMRGREEFRALQQIQRELDPSGLTWNLFATENYKIDNPT